MNTRRLENEGKILNRWMTGAFGLAIILTFFQIGLLKPNGLSFEKTVLDLIQLCLVFPGIVFFLEWFEGWKSKALCVTVGMNFLYVGIANAVFVPLSIALGLAVLSLFLTVYFAYPKVR